MYYSSTKRCAEQMSSTNNSPCIQRAFKVKRMLRRIVTVGRCVDAHQLCSSHKSKDEKPGEMKSVRYHQTMITERSMSSIMDSFGEGECLEVESHTEGELEVGIVESK